jgi:hypothetical protein
MVNAAMGDGASSDATWERPVRQISLAARDDVLAAMAKHWKTYVDGIGEHGKALHDFWSKNLADWHGPAAKACQQSLNSLISNMGKLYQNYSDMPQLMDDCSQSVRDTIGAIPIPLFGGGTPEMPAGGARTDGRGLYEDYDENRSAYADYAFRDRAYKDMIGAVRVRGSGAKAYDINNETHRSSVGHKYFAEVVHWYATHQKTATRAEDHLHNAYATAHDSVPEKTKLKIEDPSGDGSADPHATPPPGGTPPGGGGGVDTAGPALGALPPPVGGKLPSTQSAMLHSLPPHELLGPPTAGDPATADPPGTSLAGDGPGTAAGAGLGVGSAGGFGAGGLPGVGSAGGGSVGGVPTTASGAGWWSGPPIGAAAGPRVAGPGLAAAGGQTTGAARAGGVGMVPHGGSGTGRKEPDEHRTWLTEDDKDVWGPRWEDQFSGLVE